jgi:glutathione S-transferase
MYELIIANKNYSSWSMRPWVLMRTLGIPFTEKLLPFHLNQGAGAIANFSPSGRVPCLVDGDTRVWDSLAIAEYLAERHDAGVWPTDAKARAWARSAAAEMHSGFGALRNDCSMSVGVRVKLHRIGAGLSADLARLAALWSDGFARHGGPFLAGPRFTAVDAFFAPVVTRVQTYGLTLPSAAAAYAGRILELPTVKEWIAAGLAETFRDAPHETEILASGVLLADLRAPAAG